MLRVDLGTASAFPNGRKVNPGTNTEEDVTDVETAFGAAGFRVSGRRERDEWLALELTAGRGRTPDLRQKG